MSYHNWNKTTLESMRKNVSRFYRVIDGKELFFEINLTIPDSYNDIAETYNERKASERVVTLQSTKTGDMLQYLADTDNPAFTVKVFQYGNSSFTNHALIDANKTQRELKETFTVYRKAIANADYDKALEYANQRIAELDSQLAQGEIDESLYNELKTGYLASPALKAPKTIFTLTDNPLADTMVIEALAYMINKHVDKSQDNDSAKQWTTVDGIKTKKS